MRRLLIAVTLIAWSVLPGRMPAQGATELQRALEGSWVGTLKYRDYSEPPTSTKGVKLPTWLGIEIAGADLRFRYVYDDGPAKTVTENSLIRIDPAAARYDVVDEAGKVGESYSIAGLAQLRQGRGSLTLSGTGVENKAPVDVRMTFRIGRNILDISRATAGAGQPFSFRHAYTMVRAVPPGKAN